MSESKSMSTKLKLEGGVSTASRRRKVAAGNLIFQGFQKFLQQREEGKQVTNQSLKKI